MIKLQLPPLALRRGMVILLDECPHIVWCVNETGDDLIKVAAHDFEAGDYAERDELEARRELLAQALDVLNDREKDILTQRRLADKAVTLEDLSGQYDVSRERIRQIEVRAFEKLQKRMRDLAKEKGMLATA